MGLLINAPTPTRASAEKFARNHAIIKKSDLRRIRRLAKKLGFEKELLALNIEVRGITVTGDSL